MVFMHSIPSSSLLLTAENSVWYLIIVKTLIVNGNHNSKINVNVAPIKLLAIVMSVKGMKYRNCSGVSRALVVVLVVAAVVVVKNEGGFAPCRMKDVCSALSALYKLDSVNQLSTQPGSCSSLEVCETCLLAHELNRARNRRVNSIE